MQLTLDYKIIGLLLLGLFIQSCGSSSRLKSNPSSTRSKANSGMLAIAQTAKKYLGKPYEYGGHGPQSFDCSGLVSHVFAAHDIALPRVAEQQSNVGRKVSKAQLRAGDLLFFTKGKQGGKINHVAIVVENRSGRISAVHSSSSKGVIQEHILESSYWAPRFRSARRVSP